VSGPGRNAIASGHAALGTMLALTPGPPLRLLAGREPRRPELTVARVLGMRHLAEAAGLARFRGRTALGTATAVDLIHAATAIALARRDERERRLAWSNAAGATAFAVLEAVSFARDTSPR
jgi:hypothetical protein